MDNSGKFHGLNLEVLVLVRVLRTTDCIGSDNGNPVLSKPLEQKETDGNTCHFSLNGVVSNHAYGIFNGDCVVIIPLIDMLNAGHKLSGLRAEDSWFHYNSGRKLLMPENFILVAPAGTKLSENWQKKTIYYQAEFNDIEKKRKLRDDAVYMQLEKMNFLVKKINMWNWEGESINSCTPDNDFIARLGGVINTSTHANSEEENFSFHDRCLNMVINNIKAGILPRDEWENQIPAGKVILDHLKKMDEARKKHAINSHCQNAEQFFKKRINIVIEQIKQMIDVLPPLKLDDLKFFNDNENVENFFIANKEKKTTKDKLNNLRQMKNNHKNK